VTETSYLLYILVYVGVPLAIVVYALTMLRNMAADLRAIRRELEDSSLRL
jgi:hypothetical protein